MLIRCQVDDVQGLTELLRCRLFAECMSEHGYEVTYTVNKDGYESARLFLGPKAAVHRLPLEAEEEIARLTRLQKQGGHQILFVDYPQADSAYLFELNRRFRHLVVWNPPLSGPIYADLVIQSAIDGTTTALETMPGAKLLLGPKFHLGLGAPPFPSRAGQPVHAILLHLGGDEQATLRVLSVLARFSALPPVTVYGPRSSYLRRRMAAIQVGHPHLQLYEALPNQLKPFPFADFNFAICSADQRALDLAGLGLFFLNVPLTATQVRDAYQLENWGISPSLGVLEAKSDEELLSKLRLYLLEPGARVPFAENGPRWVDGQGPNRIACQRIKDKA